MLCFMIFSEKVCKPNNKKCLKCTKNNFPIKLLKTGFVVHDK